MKTNVFKAAIMVLALGACTQPAAIDTPASPPQAPIPVAEGEGQMCGGIAGIACGDGLYCNYEGGHCGAGDQAGTCRTRPTVCTLEMSPVCGCDGRVYSNSSCAAVAGVSVASRNECERRN
jgi:hypothetical protein